LSDTFARMAGPPVTGASPRPRVSQEFVEGHRRRRFVNATAEILHEFGRGGLSVTAVVRLARTARNSFYESFGGIEECIGYGIELAEAELFAGLEELSGDGDWRAELDEAVAGFFEAVAAGPLLAELFLVHSGASRTDAGRAAFLSGGERFVPLLSRGRDEADTLGRRIPSPLLDEYLSRTIVTLAARRVQESDTARLLDERGAMTRLAAEFYTGRRDP
jgi:AcrR family transcriptional regulator